MTTPNSRAAGPKRRQWLIVVACVGILCLTFGLMYPACTEVRDGEAWVPRANHLKQVGLAVVNYSTVYHRLPPAALRDKDGRPLLSWRVLILPFLEYDNLYIQFNLNEPWDGPTNMPLLAKMPQVFAQSPFLRSDTAGRTHFQVLVGPGTAFERDKLKWVDFTDGAANTITVVEAAQPVPWTKPDDLVFDPTKPLPALGTGLTKPDKSFGYRVGRKTGFLAAFGDGTIRFISESIDEQMLRALITRNGGEMIDLSMLE